MKIVATCNNIRFEADTKTQMTNVHDRVSGALGTFFVALSIDEMLEYANLQRYGKTVESLPMIFSRHVLQRTA